jgi:hypothetical protein
VPSSGLLRLFIVVLLLGFFLDAGTALGDVPSFDNSGARLLNSWGFSDTNAWVSDSGFSPLSFTNITGQFFDDGDGNALFLSNANPAFLQIPIVDSTNHTNLTLNIGSLMLWLKPSWNSTNQPAGGTGPGDWSRLIEIGSTNSSDCWWSLYFSPDGCTLYFSSRTNDGSPGDTYMSAPVSVSSNGWALITLTWSSNGSALYWNDQALSNGLAVSALPGPQAISNGFFLGSSSAGTAQINGSLDDVSTYNYQLGADAVAATYQFFPANFGRFPRTLYVASAPSSSSEMISGPGFLQYIGAVTNCPGTSSNVWFTNVTAQIGANGATTLTFGVAGGSSSLFYDVFATSALVPKGITNSQWGWMGQVTSCNSYSLTLSNTSSAWLILGKPQDSDGDGLTDAYELLVSHTNPFNPDTDGDGISDLDELLIYHTDPKTPNPAFPSGTLNVQRCPQ